MNLKNEQEDFWAGEWGKMYCLRNNAQALLNNNIELFSKIIRRTSDLKSIIEFGANIGLNLQAIKNILPFAEMAAVEINKTAINALRKHEWIDVYHQSIAMFETNKKYNLVLVKGVLIHINPADLDKVYSLLYETSNKYIVIAEYYNPTPVMVPYRGHENKLFKRDFAGEIMDKFTDLRLIDCGFCYHRDPYFPQDDLTWFLLEKTYKTI